MNETNPTKKNAKTDQNILDLKTENLTLAESLVQSLARRRIELLRNFGPQEDRPKPKF